MCANVLVSASHLDLLGVRGRIRLGSPGTRLLFLPLLLLFLPLGPQLSSRTAVDIWGWSRRASVNGGWLRRTHARAELTFTSIATSDSWATSCGLTNGSSSWMAVMPFSWDSNCRGTPKRTTYYKGKAFAIHFLRFTSFTTFASANISKLTVLATHKLAGGKKNIIAFHSRTGQATPHPCICSFSSSLSPSIPQVSWSSNSRLCWLAADSLSSAIMKQFI